MGRKPKGHPPQGRQEDAWVGYGQHAQIHVGLPDVGFLFIYEFKMGSFKFFIETKMLQLFIYFYFL